MNKHIERVGDQTIVTYLASMPRHKVFEAEIPFEAQTDVLVNSDEDCTKLVFRTPKGQIFGCLYKGDSKIYLHPFLGGDTSEWHCMSYAQFCAACTTISVQAPTLQELLDQL